MMYAIKQCILIIKVVPDIFAWFCINYLSRVWWYIYINNCTLQEVAIYSNPNTASSVDWVANKKAAEMVLNIRQVAIKCTGNMYTAQLSKCIELIIIDRGLRWCPQTHYGTMIYLQWTPRFQKFGLKSIYAMCTLSECMYGRSYPTRLQRLFCCHIIENNVSFFFLFVCLFDSFCSERKLIESSHHGNTMSLSL